MVQIKKAFFCQNCGAQSPKWMGKCPSCNEWNTFVEEIIKKENQIESWQTTKTTVSKSKALKLKDISNKEKSRLNTQSNELNRVLGGGLVAGSVILLGGEPGLANQLCCFNWP
jgi:DNA repair protein RadA/Sms